MFIFKLLRNPLIKIIGVVSILYFALFYDKKEPEALGNRLAPERIKQEIGQAHEKGEFIISNVHLARQMAQDKVRADLLKSGEELKISIEDVEVGKGEEIVECGDEVEISYIVYDGRSKQLQVFNFKKFTVNPATQQIVDQNIIGMKKGGIRSINVPYGFKSEDKQLIENMRFSSSDIRYQVTLANISRKGAMSCEETPQTNTGS
jgi:hypothetical protein